MNIRTRKHLRHRRRDRFVTVLAALASVFMAAQGTASAAVSPTAGTGVQTKTVRLFESPLSADRGAVQRGLTAGQDPTALGLHAPAPADVSKFTQKDFDALTRTHPTAVSAGSGGPATTGVQPNLVAKPPNTLSRTDCEAAVGASGGDFYVLSRYAVCESDTEYVEFYVNGVVQGGMTYQRTIVGTAPGKTTLTTVRQLNWSVFIDSVAKFGTVDPGWTLVPTSALTVVTGGSNITKTGTPPTGWAVTLMAPLDVKEWDSSFYAPPGGGAQPDDVYADLVTFTVVSLPGPGWTCLYCVPNTSQPFAMRWDNALYVPTPGQVPNTGAAVFPYLAAIEYSTTGGEAAVAKHIALACTNPAATFPVKAGKVLPGCDADHPLHRLLGKGTLDQKQYNANRRAAVSVCRTQWTRAYAQGGTLECDEFPFASTFEGASLKDANNALVNFSGWG